MNAEHFVTNAYGMHMPQLLYGTAWKQQRTAELVEQALRLGFRGIDTACQPKHYHEAGVGQGIAAWLKTGGQRQDLYLQSKFTPLGGQNPGRVPYDSAAPLDMQIGQSFAASLLNLQTDYLDGLILHSPLADTPLTLAAWQAMENLTATRGVRQLGISNCYDLQLFETLYHHASIKPAVLQNRFYADSGYDRELRAFCRQHGVVYQSFWTLTANRTVLAHATLQAIALQTGKSAEQIFFRYLTQRGIVPLTGTTSAQHMQQDLAIFKFVLTEADCRAIDNLLG